MFNVGNFAKKTVLITGGTRGIGKEIALKLARDGANIVIAAKTAKPHPRLPGTIYTAAEEIEAAGGKALPCVVDIRNEQTIEECIKKAVDKFNGIDILINNASAIQLTGTLDTPAKNYDLMHGVNVRGTYLMSQKCIPYLKQASNPHILNISPPLVMESKWFRPHVAYTMTKYGMSMCVLGMHEEFKKYKVAVNALWPRTAIWTAAIHMISSGYGIIGCRKASIMADAAYTILSKTSTDYTGNFAIDENVLREEGVTDFKQYECVHGAPLTPDFFLPDDVIKTFNYPYRKTAVRCQNIDQVADVFSIIMDPNICEPLKGKYLINVIDKNNNKTYISLNMDKGHVTRGKIDNPAAEVTLSEDILLGVMNGELSMQTSLYDGKIKLVGDQSIVFKMKKLFNNRRL